MQLDSYADTGVVVAVGLINGLVPGYAGGKAVPPREPHTVIAQVLAVDPPSVAQLAEADVPGFRELAGRLHEIFIDVRGGDVDRAAHRLNELLAAHPAAPHLAKEDGRWRLHHHPIAISLVAMWTSICAEALARMIGDGHEARFGTCQAPQCDQVFFDVSKNAKRRFCSTACQNRVKAAAFRRRHT